VVQVSKLVVWIGKPDERVSKFVVRVSKSFVRIGKFVVKGSLRELVKYISIFPLFLVTNQEIRNESMLITGKTYKKIKWIQKLSGFF